MKCRCCAGATGATHTIPLPPNESPVPPNHPRRDDVRPGIMESSWRSALTLMLFDSFMVTSLGGRVAVLAFMFLVG